MLRMDWKRCINKKPKTSGIDLRLRKMKESLLRYKTTLMCYCTVLYQTLILATNQFD